MAVDLHPDIVRAINRFADTKLGRRYGRYAKKNYGVGGKRLAAKTVAGEFGGRSTRSGKGVVSSAGARGPAQFIPSTRDAYVAKYGRKDDPWASDLGAIKSMARHHLSTGVAGYNPGMPSYTDYILGQKVNPADMAALRTGRGGGRTRRPGGVSVELEKIRTPGVDRSGERRDLRRQLLLGGKLTQDRLLEYSRGKRELADTPASVRTGDIRVKRGPGRLADKGSDARQDVRTILGPVAKDGWKGSRSVGKRLAARTGLPISSEKRGTVHTASGGVSDHYEGNKDSYAWDLSVAGPTGTKKARWIARQLGVKNWQGGSWLSVTKKINGRTYRFQVGWNVPDHYDHIHMGVDRVDTPG
jgi:hypothetical protein